MFGLGMWYLERERKQAAARNEGFIPAPHDLEPDGENEGLPSSPLQAIVPLAIVIGMIILPRLVKNVFDTNAEEIVPAEGIVTRVVGFANEQPILWPSIALVFGTCVAIFMHRGIWQSASAVVSRGAQDAIMPLVNTSVVVGFGGVVAQTAGFESFTKLVLDAPLPPLASLFFSVNVIAGIVGSASGGLRIFMETLAPSYLEMGIKPDVLHRIATVSAGGLDTLPHCGAVIATFTIMGLTHRGAYRDVFIVSVVIPMIAAIAIIAAASVF